MWGANSSLPLIGSLWAILCVDWLIEWPCVLKSQISPWWMSYILDHRTHMYWWDKPEMEQMTMNVQILMCFKFWWYLVLAYLHFTLISLLYDQRIYLTLYLWEVRFYLKYFSSYMLSHKSEFSTFYKVTFETFQL